jgi:acyl carrier protein
MANATHLHNTMTTPEIRQKFIEILDSILAVDPAAVQDESDLIRDLHADSLDVVHVSLECEVEFGIDIPDEDAEKLKTVKEWVDYLEAQMP